MATIKTMSEQVLRRLAGGDPPAGFHIHAKELEASIRQHINVALKTQYFSETLPTGETIPDGCVLATYSSVAVTQWNGVSKSALPAIPVRLPRNMGVFHIGATTEPFCSFIPLKMGVFQQVQQQRLISDLLGQVGYEVVGKEVIYTKDLTTQVPAINNVTMRLVVSDISQYTDYELLPIDADMEKAVLDEVFNVFAPVPEQPEIASSVS